MNKKNPKLRKMKMQKRVTQIEGGRYLIYYSFKNELLVNELTSFVVA